MARTTTPHDPKKLITMIRAGFVMQGTSLTAWAKKQGYDPSAIRQAVYGTWGGPKGKAVRAQVLAAAGVKEAA
ncbi:MAG: hypothetical protein WA956_05685 [Stenotrophomonas sp.]